MPPSEQQLLELLAEAVELIENRTSPGCECLSCVAEQKWLRRYREETQPKDPSSLN